MFEINNASNNTYALYTITNGLCTALRARNTGTGKAGDFDIVNSNSTSPALYAQTNGAGYSIRQAWWSKNRYHNNRKE
jgi:hypothetical protein